MHLESFLKSEKAMRESWEIIEPIFCNLCDFANEWAPQIYREFDKKQSLINRDNPEQAIEQAGSIVDNILQVVDREKERLS